MERRLAAIFVVDVVGYSRLMEEGEVGTHAASKSCHRELVRPNIDQHGGRIVKLTGDGALAEFPSAINAVRCTVDIPWSRHWAYKNPRDRARLREGWQRAGVPSHVKNRLQR